jgi:hypothetical protein
MYVIKKADVTKEDFERLVFVLKARAKEASRPHLGVLHVEELPGGSRLVATDGKRLHVGEVRMKLAGGEYLPTVTKNKIRLVIARGVRFPNWKQVVPEKPVDRGIIDLSHTGIGRDYDLARGMSTVFRSLIRKTGEAVNIRHLEELPKISWRVLVAHGKGGPIMFRQNGAGREAFAVIAPVEAAA